MRKVLRNTDEVIHVFAQQTQSEGRNQSGNIFFYNNKIYSYGYHYLLGEFIDKETILINDKGYSVTTSKHIYSLIDATRQYKRFNVTESNLDLVHAEIKETLIKIPKARTNKATYLKRILYLFEKLNEYLIYTKTKAKVSKLKEYREIKKIVQRLETNKDQILLEVAEILKTKEKRQLEKNKEAIKLWRSHEKHYLHGIKNSLLRLSKDFANVETSGGVKIEVKKAKVLYKLIEAGKDIKGFKLDYYTVIGIKDNILKIGCHNIPLNEVQSIGKQLIKL
jgi:hypothetical protein